MGDRPPRPPPAMSSSDGLAFTSSNGPAASATGPDKTATRPQPSSTATSEPQLGCGSAMFSTDLGRRALRRLQGPSHPPVIVKSDRIHAVVTAAGIWRNKYPYQYMCIFPQGGWRIDDLWDEEDIHIDTESFCKETLYFIERDNCVRAQKYAQDWSKMHPERLPIVGGDMSELYDKASPLFVVDKIFVNGEMQEYPLIFLWHVAHMMRGAMLVVKGARLPASASVPVSPNIEHNGSVTDGNAQGSATVERSAPLPPVPSPSSSGVHSSTRVADLTASMTLPKPIPSFHADRPPPPQRSDAPPAHGRLADPIESGSYAEPMAHMIPSVPEHQMGSANLGQPSLQVPKNKSGRSASGTYRRIVPTLPYVENMPHVPSGHGPHPYVSPLLQMQSPRLHQAHMAMAHPLVNMHRDVVPFAYEQTPVAPVMVASQSPHPEMFHPGIMPPHATLNPSMAHGYLRQPSGSQGSPHAIPMGDMTNMYYSPGMPPQSMDPWRPGYRRYSQQHGAGNALFDPYEGSNPAFRAGGYPNGKKYTQNGIQNSNGRQRKASATGSRPYHTQYANDRASHVQPIGSRFTGPKGHRGDDLAATQDPEYGCNTDWIGPQNMKVNELFLKDLPEDIRDAELEALFNDRIGFKPIMVKIGSAAHPQHTLQGRRHAFVGFTTPAIAKQAIRIHMPTIRGQPVSITVPKRFFQKIVEVPQRDAIEGGPSTYSRFTSNLNTREARDHVSSINEGDDIGSSAATTQETLSYSPQDARSDLHKKKKGKQPQQDSTDAGSPEARKAKPKKRQKGPVLEELAQPTKSIQHSALNDATEAENHPPASGTATIPFPDLRMQSEQPQTSKDTSVKLEQKISPSTAEVSHAVHVPMESEHPSGVMNNKPSPLVDQRQGASAQQVTLQPQKQSHAIELHVDSAKQIPIAHLEKISSTTVQPTKPAALGSEVTLDELKNDTSFYWAAESQSDLDADVGLSAALDIVSQGTTILSPMATACSATDIAQPASSVSAANTASEGITALSIDTVVPPESTVVSAAIETRPFVDNSKFTITLPTPSKTAEASANMQEEAAPSKSSPIFPVPVKKSGAQHTSLHPFAQNKAQLKREKAQKKKAQKKEKEEAEKAKAAKTIASKSTAKSRAGASREAFKESITGKSESTRETKGTTTFESFAKDSTIFANKDPSVPTQGVSVVEQSVKKPASTARISKGAIDSRDKPGKCKAKEADITLALDTTTVDNKGNDHGKQAGSTISILNGTGSVTNKEVQPNLLEGELASDAKYSKPKDSKDASTGAKESDTAATFAEGTQSGRKKNKKKKKKKAPPRVWPDLEFRSKSPNPGFMGPIDMETDVQNYDTIMDEACGGEEDSDFSWSNLPKMVASEDEQQGSASAGGGDDGDEHSDLEWDTLLTRIADPEAQHAIARLDREMPELGQALFPKISEMQPMLANKIIVKLLEGHTNAGIARLLSDEPALRTEVALAASALAEQLKTKDGPAGKENSVEAKTVTAASQEAVIQSSLAALKTHVGTTTEELRTATVDRAVAEEQVAQRTITQGPSNTVTPDSQPARMKKPNKNKKKKQQQPDMAAKDSATAESSKTVNATETTEKKAPISNTVPEDQIDSNDPFHKQLKSIEAVKRGFAGPANTQDTESQQRASIAKSKANDQLMRTMEGYFRETQGHSQSKEDRF